MLLAVSAFAAGVGYRNIQVNFSGARVRVNGKEVKLSDEKGMPLEVFNYNGSIYAPIRGIAQALGNEVGWNPMENTVVIGDKTGVRNELPERTLLRFLKIAMEPVGTTMYVWGGGWNEEDTGAGTEAVSIGVSPRWKEFFERQTSAYDYHNTRYQIHDGLDCSGYVGWALYNLFHTRAGENGYVMKAQDMASAFAGNGWGDYHTANEVKDFRPGDIMSSSGHVYIVVGACSDGSIVIAHSSPPGVQLCGTSTPGGRNDSEAVALAKEYMKKYFPKWHARYPDCSRGVKYLSTYNQMRWRIGDGGVMTDPEGIASMPAEKVLAEVFKSLRPIQ